ncbi:MAG: Bro-N domain-containing protein [Candidatus Taylorbacteria bacterium]|nr:Bro-N domain-containing protein [Candidatus Taylorbacteria bacterium]
MENKKIQNNIHPTIFEETEVRRVWHNEQWFFCIADVVQVLTDSKDAQGYIKDMRRRDVELSTGWGQIATPLSVETKGGVQKLNCGSLKGIFRIIQSIPSPKAEPFKLWLAQVGQERIEEIQDPERAIVRAKKIYEQKGYQDDWIAKRMRGINVRNTLTDEWQQRGAKEGYDFAILTNEIYRGTFEMDTKQIKEYKSLSNPDNPRDHMSELELILTMLGEATTTKITTEKDSHGFEALKGDAKIGGEVAGRTRRDIEIQTGKKVMLKENFKNQKFLKGKNKK